MRRAVAGWIVAGHLHQFRQKGGLRGEIRVHPLAHEITQLRHSVVRLHPSTLKLSRKSRKAAAASEASAAARISSGWWLMPPLPQRTNSMATSVRRDIMMAS